MKPEKWNPGRFWDLYGLQPNGLQPSPARLLAYQAHRELLAKRDLKLLREWEIFRKFCQAAELGVEPEDVVMLDPSSSRPAPPDLKCQLAAGPHFFELGEIVQQNAARVSASLARRLIAGGRMPLVRIWDPLEKMLTKKLKKTYDPEARPASLVLYYANGPSFWELLRPLIAERAADIQIRFELSVFDSMWLFDATTGGVLFCFSRSLAPVIN